MVGSDIPLFLVDSCWQFEFLQYFIEWLHVWFTFDKSISLARCLDLKKINKILQNTEMIIMICHYGEVNVA